MRVQCTLSPYINNLFIYKNNKHLIYIKYDQTDSHINNYSLYL